MCCKLWHRHACVHEYRNEVQGRELWSQRSSRLERSLLHAMARSKKGRGKEKQHAMFEEAAGKQEEVSTPCLQVLRGLDLGCECPLIILIVGVFGAILSHASNASAFTPALSMWSTCQEVIEWPHQGSLLERMAAVKPFWDTLSEEQLTDILTVSIADIREKAASLAFPTQNKQGELTMQPHPVFWRKDLEVLQILLRNDYFRSGN